MNRYARKVFLYASIILFFIVAPTVIAYALGYSFDWETKKPVLTGGFYFQSLPKKSSIYIDGDLQEGKTPLLLKRIIPQYYQIRIEKEGYTAWEKKLKVEPKIVTAAKDIILVPLEPKIELVKENLPADFSLAEYLSGVSESEATFYFENGILYQTDSPDSKPKQISLDPIKIGKEYNLITKEDDLIALIDGDQTLYFFNQSTKIFEPIATNVSFTQFSENNRLLYIADKEIWVYNDGNKELITRSGQKINQAVWYHNEHIIFTIGSTIKIAEMDSRQKRNIFDLAKISTNQIAGDFENQLIYLVSSDQLFSLSLSLE